MPINSWHIYGILEIKGYEQLKCIDIHEGGGRS